MTTATTERTIELILPPHEQQRKFINAAQLEQLYGGAKRGGKSVALAMKIALLSLQFPGNRGLLARKDFTDLRDSTLTTFFQVLPSELILDWNKSERLIQIKTGAQPSQVLYRGLGDVHEVEKSKGIDLGWLAIDEPSEIDEATYLMLRAQLTWVLPNGTRPPYMCLLASNPEPGWVKRRFITNPAPGSIFIPSLPRDNPGLPTGWEADLRNSYPADWITKYLEGSWDVAEGQVFTEFDRQTHIVNKIDPGHMKLVAAIDHATTGTTCMVIVGLDSSGNINLLAEYYKQNALVSQHAAAMQDLMAEFGGKKRFDYILIDPSTESKTQQGVHELYSVQDEYRRNGIFTTTPYRSQIHIGIDLVKEYLHVNPKHVHPWKQILGSPALFIVGPRCPNLIREMLELKKEISESGNALYVGDDHAVDCLRYIVMSRPKRPDMQKADAPALLPHEARWARAHQKWAKGFAPKAIQNTWGFQ